MRPILLRFVYYAGSLFSSKYLLWLLEYFTFRILSSKLWSEDAYRKCILIFYFFNPTSYINLQFQNLNTLYHFLTVLAVYLCFTSQQLLANLAAGLLLHAEP